MCLTIYNCVDEDMSIKVTSSYSKINLVFFKQIVWFWPNQTLLIPSGVFTPSFFSKWS